MNNETPTSQMVQDLLAWSERLDVLGDIIQTIASYDEPKLASFTNTLGGIVSDYSKAINETADTIIEDIKNADDILINSPEDGAHTDFKQKLKDMVVSALREGKLEKSGSKKRRSSIIRFPKR